FAFRPDSPDGFLVVPRVVVGRRNGRTWVTEVVASEQWMPERTPTWPVPSTPIEPVEPVEFEPGAMTPEGFEAAVAAVVSRIRAGEVGKVVLARDVTAHVPL